MLQGDIRDVAFIQTALQGVSLVIHTASLIDVVGKIDKQILRDVNVKGKNGDRCLGHCKTNSGGYTWLRDSAANQKVPGLSLASAMSKVGGLRQPTHSQPQSPTASAIRRQ